MACRAIVRAGLRVGALPKTAPVRQASQWTAWQKTDPLPPVKTLTENPPFEKGRLSLRDTPLSPVEKIIERRKIISKTFTVDPKLLDIDTINLLLQFKNSPGTTPEIMAAIDASLKEKYNASALSENVISVNGDPTFACMNYDIDGTRRWIVGTTNENSIAAGNDEMAWRIALCGGFKTVHVDPSLMATQVLISPTKDGLTLAQIQEALSSKVIQGQLASALEARVPKLKSLTEKHGGGLTGEYEINLLQDTSSGRLELLIWVNMAEMMGANVANLIAEEARKIIPTLIGSCDPYAGILSNDASRRTATVECRIHPDLLTTKTVKDGHIIAQNIQRLSEDADNSRYRGPTGLKGELNQVVSLAIATGQDYRALDVGIAKMTARGLHHVRPLTQWTYTQEGWLHGTCTLGAHFSTVGIINSNPTAKSLLQAMKITSEAQLRVLATASILPTSLAALRSIVTEGNSHHHLDFTPNFGQKAFPR